MTSSRWRTAWVTGAASGIGAALVDVLVEGGVDVVATDLSLDRLAARHAPEAVHFAEVDVSRDGAFDALVEARGAPDLLVNNAGIGMAGEVRDVPLSDWRRALDVNTMGVARGLDAVYPLMSERGDGQIVTVASGAGLLPRPGMVPYAASKAAVIGLCTSLRPEAAAYGVRVNVACPGYIATDIMNATTYRGVDGDGLRAAIPLKPMSAERCARIILEGARRDRAVIPVSAATWLEWMLWRASPGLTLKIASFRAKKFRQHRLG